MRRLQSIRIIWIPKRIIGKSFINNLKKDEPTLKIPEEATNEIFSLILEPNELLGPFPFERWVQSSTAIARKFVKEIYTVYYKPPFQYASTIKLEFHKNHWILKVPASDSGLTVLVTNRDFQHVSLLYSSSNHAQSILREKKTLEDVYRRLRT